MEKLKILYVLNEADQIGGSSLSLYNLSESVKKYVEPYILVRRRGEVFDFFVAKGYKCFVVPFRLNYISDRYKGIKYIFKLLINRIILFFGIYRTIFVLKKDKIRPDIVHTNSSVADIGFYIARKLKKPHVWHVREFVDLGLKIRPIYGYDHWKKMVASSDSVIVISEALMKHLNFEKHENVYLIYDAVISAKEHVKREEKEKYVLFVAGTIHKIKFPERAVEIFCKSRLFHENYKLRMVGRCDDEMKLYLKNIASEFGCPDGVEFIPFTKNVGELFAKASAMIMCSEYEGLGRVIIEAMFYRCPVLAYASGPSPEIIKDGVTGFLYGGGVFG